MITDKQKQEFIAGYLAAALWSSTDTVHEDDGSETYVQLDQYEWADGESEKLHADCFDFMDEHNALLETYAQLCPVSGEYTAWELAGHDFWLTRNGHGAGFWDRGLGYVGKALARGCGLGTPYHEINLYLGDDDLVHCDAHPKAYCVQYRNMQNGAHHLRVYPTRAQALAVAERLQRGDAVDCEEALADISINYRRPPIYWYKEPGNELHIVRIMNAGNIPDLW